MPSTDVVAAGPGTTAALGREQHLQAALEASHVWVQVAGPETELEHIEREVGCSGLLCSIALFRLAGLYSFDS